MFRRAVELFLLLPDLQQGEQLCCKHQIAASIIDFFQFLLRSWQSNPWQPENLSGEVEDLLSWKLVFSEDVCLIDVAIISAERRGIIK